MGWLGKIFGSSDTVKAVGDTLDNLFTSDDERLEREIDLAKTNRDFDYKENQLVAQQNIAQTEVNKVEAASSSLFVAGWRPAIGWVGATALAYQFILYPLMCWLPLDKAPPAPLDYTLLYGLISGMLGIASLRSFDKARGTDTKQARRIK